MTEEQPTEPTIGDFEKLLRETGSQLTFYPNHSKHEVTVWTLDGTGGRSPTGLDTLSEAWDHLLMTRWLSLNPEPPKERA